MNSLHPDSFPWSAVLRASMQMNSSHLHSQDALLHELVKVFQTLKLRGFVCLLTDDQYLSIQSHGMSHSLITTLNRLFNQSFIGYRFNPSDVDVYQDVLQNGQSTFIEDREAVLQKMLPNHLKPICSRLYRILGKGKIIVAPLQIASETIGTLTLIAERLSPDDVVDASAFANLIAAAFQRVRQQESLEASQHREDLRNLVLDTLAKEHNLQRTLPGILKLSMEAIGVEGSAIALLDETSTCFTIAQSNNLPRHLICEHVPVEEDPISRSITGRQTIRLNPLRMDIKANPAWIKAGVRSFLSVPLFAGEETLGSMVFFSLANDDSFTDVDVELVQSIASITAIAIQNEKLFSSANQSAIEAQALIQTAKSISSSLDQETVLQLIAEQAQFLLQADGSRIHLYSPDRSRLHCLLAIGPYAEALMAHEIFPGEGLTGTTAAEGNAILINDLSQHPEHLHIPGVPWDRQEYLALAPLSIRQQIMGTMTVARSRGKQCFSPKDLELLKALAAHASIALENANLYKEIETQAQRLESEVLLRTQELVLSENRYRALVETALAGICQLDRDTRFTYVNQALGYMLKMPIDSILNQRLDETNLLTPKSLENALQRFRDRMYGKRPPQDIYEIELQASTGEIIPTLLAVSMTSDEKGQSNGVTCLLLDISDRKHLEADLRAERDRLDALLNNIGDAVVVTNPQGMIEYVNPAWEEQNQYSRSDVLGKQSSIISSGKHPKSFYTEMWETILKGEIWQGEVINMRRNGELYDAALTITPVMSAEGNMISIVGVQHDISAFKAVDRLKTEFVSDVSHELRTPLTNIRLYLELLAKAEESDRREMYLNTLYRESGRLAELIEDLLTLSRMDAKASPFSPLEFNLNQMLVELVEDRQPLAQQKGLSLTFSPGNAIHHAYGDPRLLIQVFSNLLTNAMNYTPAEGRITVRTRNKKKRQNWVLIDVIDTGLGIPPEEQKNVFQRFFRGAASKKTNAPGTGLGLAICNDIVGKHGGHIVLKSGGDGEGTRFTVWLPVQANTPLKS